MSVGYKLYREVYHFAPSDWTSGELLTALMIADDANEETRQSWIQLPELCRRTRLTPSGLRASLSRLGRRGYEFRVIHGYGKDGRPVFAARGHAVDYLVPDLAKGALPVAPYDGIGATPVSPNGHGPLFPGIAKALPQHTKALLQCAKGATAVAPLSSVPQYTSTTPPPVVPPSVEGNGYPQGGATRQPIELEAWLASLEARRLGRQR